MNLSRVSVCLFVLTALSGCAVADADGELPSSTESESALSAATATTLTCTTKFIGASYGPGSFRLAITTLEKPSFDARTQQLSFDATATYESHAPYVEDPAASNTRRSTGTAKGRVTFAGQQLVAFGFLDGGGNRLTGTQQLFASTLEIDLVQNGEEEAAETTSCAMDKKIAMPLFAPSTAIPSQGAVVPVKQFIAGGASHATNVSCTGYPGCLRGFQTGDAIAYSVNVAEAKAYSFDVLVENAGPTPKQLTVSVNGGVPRLVTLPASQKGFAYRFPTSALGLEKGPNVVTLAFGNGFTTGNVATIAQLAIH